jgi:hypothetical protein
MSYETTEKEVSSLFRWFHNSKPELLTAATPTANHSHYSQIIDSALLALRIW